MDNFSYAIIAILLELTARLLSLQNYLYLPVTLGLIKRNNMIIEDNRPKKSTICVHFKAHGNEHASVWRKLFYPALPII